MMNRLLVVSSLTAATSVLAPTPARAADAATTACLTASENSYKFAKAHQLLAERAELLICAASSCPADVRNECLRRVDEVTATIPRIVFVVKDSTGKDISAVKVTMDGAPIAERLDGTAITLDPGDHKFTFEIAGEAPIERQFVISESQKDRREVISLEAKPAPPIPEGAAPPVVPGPTQDFSTQGAAARDSALSKQKVAAIVVGSMGVVGVGVGSIFGLMSKSKHNQADQHCSGANCSDQTGVDLRSEARSRGNVATVAFIVGAAGLAGGTALWLTAPRNREMAGGQVGLVPGGIVMKGTW